MPIQLAGREAFDGPLVSIGLPTYNGARFLRESLESLLAQEYMQFEILVSDNGSTDGTEAIGRDFAARDSRVRYVRQPANLGAAANFNYVFRETGGTLFMWASDDDLWDPRFLTSCVAALHANATAVLACSRIRFIDEHGVAFNGRDMAVFDNPDLSSRSVTTRVEHLLSRHGWYQIYGLIRRDVLASVRPQTEAYGADVVLVTELALRGPFVRVDEVLFQFRIFERQAVGRGGEHQLAAESDRVRRAPYSNLQEACAAAIASAPVGFITRGQAWLGMVRATFLHRTRIAGWIRGEIRDRFHMAIADRDVRSIVKYGALLLARWDRR